MTSDDDSSIDMAALRAQIRRLVAESGFADARAEKAELDRDEALGRVQMAQQEKAEVVRQMQLLILENDRLKGRDF